MAEADGERQDEADNGAAFFFFVFLFRLFSA